MANRANVASATGGVDRYMNKFLDFAADVWQQQQITTENYQQYLHETAGYAHGRMDELQHKYEESMERNLNAAVETVQLQEDSIKMKEDLQKLEKENYNLRRRLEVQEVEERGNIIQIESLRRRLEEQNNECIESRRRIEELETEKASLIQQLNRMKGNVGITDPETKRKVPAVKRSSKSVLQDRSIWMAVPGPSTQPKLSQSRSKPSQPRPKPSQPEPGPSQPQPGPSQPQPQPGPSQSRLRQPSGLTHVDLTSKCGIVIDLEP